MKELFTAHDLATVVAELNERKIDEAYLQNCYDVNKRTICLKLSTKVDGERKKYCLLIESGVRLHLIDEFTALRDRPTGFCSKLRKHIGDRRLRRITQLNRDRVVDFEFGEGEGSFHLVAELYAAGNILLLDEHDRILMLLHQHKYTEEQSERVKIGNIYPRHLAVADLSDYELDPVAVYAGLVETARDYSSRTKLRQLLIRSPVGIFGPTLIDHAAAKLEIGLTARVDSGRELPLTEGQLSELISEIRAAQQTVGREPVTVFKGDERVGFYPQRYAHLKPTGDDWRMVIYPSFNEAVRTYFADEFVTLADAKQVAQTVAETKKLDQNSKAVARIERQLHDYESELRERQLVREEFEEVAHRWTPETFEQVSENRKEKTITYQTGSGEFVFDTQQSAFKNLTTLYELEKRLEYKIERTRTALTEVTKREAKRVSREPEVELIDRKPRWFEKYHWCYTSDGVLVVVGKSADQNEELVSKYLSKTTLYLHSEAAGSGSGIVMSREASPRDLEEAGAFLICHTRCWKEGVPAKAWWVEPEQVSKTPPTGEYVTKGSFIIRGKKNFLSLPRLEYGLSIRFQHADQPVWSPEAQASGLESAVVIGSPYSATRRDRLRVKLKPGTQKIGKTIKAIREFLLKSATPTEAAAIRRISLDDFHRVMVSPVSWVRAKN